jgi:predicted O-methyltransferase YrrM
LTPSFTSDWFPSRKTKAWLDHIAPRLRLISQARWLEIGSYEGRSALWTLDNVLLPDATITCVDLFDDKVAGIGPGTGCWNVPPGYSDRFDANVAGRPNIIKLKGSSSDILEKLNSQGTYFDGAYLDGDHREASVTRDLELTWPMLVPGAVLVCDDYYCADHPGARIAIDKFCSLPDIKHQILYQEFQIIIQKLS